MIRLSIQFSQQFIYIDIHQNNYNEFLFRFQSYLTILLLLLVSSLQMYYVFVTFDFTAIQRGVYFLLPTTVYGNNEKCAECS